MSDEQLLRHAYAEANQLHHQAVLLGYKVGLHFELTSKYGIGQPANVTYSFWVRRVDQPSGTEKTFATVEEAKKHLEHVATLPRYCLDLEGPWIEVVSDRDGTATWIMDRETGQHFIMRTADLKNVTQVCVYAETAPTGNWRKA